jgi:hypothetical protein
MLFSACDKIAVHAVGSNTAGTISFVTKKPAAIRSAHSCNAARVHRDIAS